MPLRTRIALFVGVATLLLSVIFVIQVVVSVRVTDQSARRDMTVLIEAMWQNHVDDESAVEEEIASRIRRDVELLNAVFQQRPDAVLERMDAGGLSEGRAVIILDQQLAPIYTNLAHVPPAYFRDTISRMVRTSDTEGFAQLDMGGGSTTYRLKIVPLRFRFSVVGYAIVATPLSRIVSYFDQGVELNAKLLAAGADGVPPEADFVGEGTALIPLTDGFTHGRVLGFLAVSNEVSAELRQTRWLQWLTGGLVVVFVGHLLGGLVWMVKRAFRPLDAAIDVIDRLTRGEEAPPLDTSTGTIEIQRLSKAVEALRAAHANQEALHRLQAELAIASELQQALLPRGPLLSEGVAFHGQMVPSQEVAGDYFDYFTIDDRRVGFLIADVCGKGTPAALFMAMSRTVVRSLAMTGRPPGEVLAEANRVLAESNDQNLFVTMFYGIFDRVEHLLLYANAGHVSPILKSGDGEVAYLPETGDLVLGMIPDLTYATVEMPLAPRSLLVCYTDGIPEAFDDSDSQFGDERLMMLVRQSPNRDPAELMQELQTAVLDFAGRRPQYDDITLCIGSFPG
ncbi:serine phosphatase RsbU (regulator of sigma subunit) [Pseudorhizobium tarimense]|uniref:Serine phosphatase RsbU (Regulator of sigma subunit) n=1 Tax=Pseudorhizobium tarimense TaxID=1079109 RepID=A0ABV2H484_9HYPH|nr:PP2C family protein-serine/threonine phosphatase [Pseudorhizobium tarimense]MCJ8518583.1 serine/threonine-protein phosphatase [Pseudorhizobium tarimense]